MPTFIVKAFAGLAGLQVWHFIVAGVVVWTGIVGVKAYRLGSTVAVAEIKQNSSDHGKQANAINAKKRAAIDKLPASDAVKRLRAEVCADCN